MKVLIVEDNLQTREMLELWLGDVAAEIKQCEDGADALNLYTSFMPDLVLMDWEMKVTDGLTATRQIISAFPAAKIVMVTLHDKTELRQAAAKAGASGFVSKDDLQALHQYLFQ